MELTGYFRKVNLRATEVRNSLWREFIYQLEANKFGNYCSTVYELPLTNTHISIPPENILICTW
jgi:hypothetical protein